MTDAPRYRTLHDYLRVLRERRVLILLTTIVFGVAAYVYFSGQDKVYEAEASLSFQDPILDENTLGGDSISRRPAQFESAIGAAVVAGPEVARRVRDELGLNMSLKDVRDLVTARREATTDLVVVTVEDGDPRRAAELANTFANETVELRTAEERAKFRRAARTLRRRLAREERLSQSNLGQILFGERIATVQALAGFAEPVALAEEASIPADPISPQVSRNTIFGALIGLTVGIMLAFLLDALDRRLRGVQQIQSELDLPLLATVPEDALAGASPFEASSRTEWQTKLEAFRIIRRNLDFAAGKPVRSVAVTSAAPEEGKSSVAVALAWAYVATGRRTLLVDCDLRRGELHKRLGIPPTPGLTDFLAGRAPISDIMHAVPWRPPSENGKGRGNGQGETELALTCIPAGTAIEGPAEALESAAFKDFLAVTSRSFDRVVIDTSPLLAVADTLELLEGVEGIIVCVRASRTTREQAGALRSVLANFPHLARGLVVTGVSPRDQPAYGYYTRRESDTAQV